MTRLIAVSTLIGCIAWSSWSLASLMRARSAAWLEAENMAAISELAAGIRLLGSSPEQALLSGPSQADLIRRIELAGETAGISRDTVTRIHPQAERRLEDSAYLAYPTTVELRAVSLAELVAFLGELVARDPALRITALHVTLPRSAISGNDTERWHVEITLTHLIFSPKSSRPENRRFSP